MGLGGSVMGADSIKVMNINVVEFGVGWGRFVGTQVNRTLILQNFKGMVWH